MTPQEQVLEFHRAFGCVIGGADTDIVRDLPAKLIEEEAGEAVEALRAGDSLLHVAQELADLVYVTYSAAITLGIDLDTAVAEVHLAAMSKLGEDGLPIRRGDGKVLKGKNYRPPNMNAAVNGAHRPPVVYLAGPMTGIREWNFPAFHTATAQLRAAGYTVINPAEHGLDETDWATCMRRGLREMLTAQVVVVLPGWERSRGAALETHVAQVLEMPVYELDVFLHRTAVTS